MRKKHLHIHKVISVILLWVFSIALTPWSAFHNHHHEAEHSCNNEANCGHKLHVGNHSDTCLICAAHFEKNFLKVNVLCSSLFSTKLFFTHNLKVRSAYTEIIGSSLRGPPLS